MSRWSKSAVALLAITALAGCQQDRADTAAETSDPRVDQRPVSPGDTRPTPAEAERRPVVALSGTEAGHLVDGAGQTLYVLAGNEDGNRCDDACEDAWPPVQTEDVQPQAGPGVQQNQLGTMPRADGGLHVTWDGEPLYRYAADSGVGATAGHGVEDQWGKWSLVSPEGSPIQE